MSRRHEQALTLVETLVALAVMSLVMTAAYATIQQSLKLHRANSKESSRLLARCELAEQLSADFHGHRRAVSLAPDRWRITRQDNEEVSYLRDGETIVRQAPDGARKSFAVGKTDMSLAGDALRLRFADTELVLSR